MVVDVGVVKNYIKPKTYHTLYNMRKVDLIEYIRTLENNYNVAVSFNENQARYIESLGIKKVVRCKDCKHWDCLRDSREGQGYCLLESRGNRQIWTWHHNDFCSYGERKDNDI